jgi:hypothetical protein
MSDDGSNDGRMFYMRSYETGEDREHNQNGGFGRARSGSMGRIDESGLKTDRFHFHAINGQRTMITRRPDAYISKSDAKKTTVSSRPMTIPGAVKYGVFEGVKR